LHWVTAIIVIALWFIGRSIAESGPEQIDIRRALHVSIAASAWALLLLRVFWRFRSGHPRIRGQSDLIHFVAKTTHYTMLLVMIVMLLSGAIQSSFSARCRYRAPSATSNRCRVSRGSSIPTRRCCFSGWYCCI